jgi:hypothetical protein
MIRTQIYITKEMHGELVRVARARKEAMAEVIRKFLAQALSHAQPDDSGKHTLKNIANLGFKGGPKDLSKKLDTYLYGKHSR